MKILCVSDEVDPLVYSTNMRERYKDVSMVLGAGDVPMRYYGFIVSMLNKPLYFVFGNHQLEHLSWFRTRNRKEFMTLEDERMTPAYSFGSTYVGDRVIHDRKTGLIIAGLGGSMRYNHERHQFTDRQMFLRILLLIPRMFWCRIRYGRWVDILLTHAPPRGIHDKEDQCHLGFTSFLWFMRKFRPRYLLHGHIHLLDMNDRRITKYLDTTIVNVYSRHVLEIDDDVIRKRMRRGRSRMKE